MGKGLATKKKTFFLSLSEKKNQKNVVDTKLEGGGEGLSVRASKTLKKTFFAASHST